MRTISDEDDRKRGPSKSALQEMLRQAVVNTGGTAPTKPKAPAQPPPLAGGGQLRPIGRVAPASSPGAYRHLAPAEPGARRRIDVSKLSAVKFETEPGEKPKLYWLPLTRLTVDDRYQRNVLETGLTNVYRIAREFDWRKFSPVIVADVDDEKGYAIIDGQHRCYAAALRGIPEVPCMVIKATLAEQAAAFAAINGRITRISELHVHAAAVTAGEPDASALDAVCKAAGVEVCRYPVPENMMKPGQTLAIGTLRQCMRMHGGGSLELALRCIMAAHPKNAGALRAPLIRALCDVVAGLNGARSKRALAVARDADFIAQIAEAKVRGAVSRRAVRVELHDALCTLFDPEGGE